MMFVAIDVLTMKDKVGDEDSDAAEALCSLKQQELIGPLSMTFTPLGVGPNDVANEKQTKPTCRRRSKALKKKRVKLDASIVKQKKSTCGRRSKKKGVTILNKSRDIIQQNIRDNNLAYVDIINLLGECVLYESLFIWKLNAKEQEGLGRTLVSILGDIYVIVNNNHKSLVSSMLKLTQMKTLENLYGHKCDEVTSLVMKEAMDFVLRLATVRAYQSRNNIRDYCLERLKKTRYVSAEDLTHLVEATFKEVLKEDA